jgi:endoglucanase
MGGRQAVGGAVASGGSAMGGALSKGGATVTGGTSNTSGGSNVGGSVAGSAPMSTLPPLHVEGAAIKDPSGKTIVLRGVSLIDIGTLYYSASQSAAGITARIDKLLAAGLKPRVVRMPVYPRTCTNPAGQPFYSAAPFPLGPMAPTGTHVSLSNDDYLNKVLKPAVDYATEKNLYVIIDYHQIDNTTGQSASDASAFWQYMAEKFASYPNVIYEAYNEPIDSATPWATFKPRAQVWVDTIRAGAPNNLIIMSSMSYAQRPGDAASSPLSGSNLAYSAHIYPGNWTAGFQNQVASAVTKVPLVISEWGYVQNGSDANLGTSDANWGASLQTLVDGNGASWTAWVADDSWTPNMFTARSNLATLSPFGLLTKAWLEAKADSDWVE